MNAKHFVATLLIAVSMIGCTSPESNSTGASQEADGNASVSPERGPASARDASGAAFPNGDAGAGDLDPLALAAEPERVEAGAGRGRGAAAPLGTVLFVGTSLTAGRGLLQEESFPLLIERRIEAAGLPFRVVNAGVSGETSAGALARIGWLLRQPFDVAIIETGANDMLRGVDPAVTEQNIQAMIDRIRSERPGASIVLAGMLSLPNLGRDYGAEFEALYPRLAERNDLVLIPFLLERVGGERDLNQSDGLHPNAAGHRQIAETVWRVLEPVLAERVGADD